jgi:hypothetical protein
MGNHKDKIRRHDSGGRMDGSELNQLEQKCHGTCMGRDKPPMQEHAQQSWGGLNIAKPAYFMNQQWFNGMNAQVLHMCHCQNDQKSDAPRCYGTELRD